MEEQKIIGHKVVAHYRAPVAMEFASELNDLAADNPKARQDGEFVSSLKRIITDLGYIGSSNTLGFPTKRALAKRITQVRQDLDVVSARMLEVRANLHDLEVRVTADAEASEPEREEDE